MIRVGVIGATGYTALEAIRLINRHPEATVTAVTSRQDQGMSIAEVHPSLAGRLDLPLSMADPQELSACCDVVFCCLPHAASAESVRTMREVSLRVVDLSADFRLRSQSLYEAWYGVKHPWPEQLGQIAYGLPELFAEHIAGAAMVANPGCYPTSAILPLAPLAATRPLEGRVIIDSKSGVSGAGRTPKRANLYCEANESISAYAVARHRHQPEIVDVIDRFCGRQVNCLFTPHLTPMDRGILSTIYIPRGEWSVNEIYDCWERQYRDCPFVQLVEAPPATKHVSGTNSVHMAAVDADDTIVIVTAIDNVLKGASGAAVQNMNLMFGMDATLGLLD